MDDAILGTDGRILVVGDFNTRALKWGMPHTDSRGKRILEMAAKTGLAVLNTGSTPTFRRSGCEGSIPDVTFASESLEVYSASDHQFIAFEEVVTNSRFAQLRRSFCAWNVAKVNTGRFVDTLGTGMAVTLQPTLS